MRLTIVGHVQGVGFRAFTKKQAQRLGITGWVKNCDDGTVEIIANGDEEKLKMLAVICEKGPMTAVVKQIMKEEIPLQSINHFEIRY